MAFTKTSRPADEKGNVRVDNEQYTLPASATTEYSSVIKDFQVDGNQVSRYVTFTLNASAVTGTNLDIALYGASTEAGSKYLLKDAIVADITATGIVAGIHDLNLYPAPYYFIAWTSDVDESANTIDLEVIGVPSR